MMRREICWLFLLSLFYGLSLFFTPGLIQGETLKESQLIYRGKKETGQDRFLLNTDDLLPMFKNVMPGDRITQTLKIKNQSTVETELFLSLVQVEEKGEDFFSRLDLLITLDEVELYRGSLGSLTKEESISLGHFQQNEEKKFTLVLSIPLDLDNQYNDYRVTSEWLFVATDSDVIVPKQKPFPAFGEIRASTLAWLGTLMIGIGLFSILKIKNTK